MSLSLFFPRVDRLKMLIFCSYSHVIQKYQCCLQTFSIFIHLFPISGVSQNAGSLGSLGSLRPSQCNSFPTPPQSWKITSGQASNGNNNWQTPCSIIRLPVGWGTMVRKWCCPEGQCPTCPRAVPSRVGSPRPPFSQFGHLKEQNFSPTPWGCEQIKSFSRSPVKTWRSFKDQNIADLVLNMFERVLKKPVSSLWWYQLEPAAGGWLTLRKLSLHPRWGHQESGAQQSEAQKTHVTTLKGDF